MSSAELSSLLPFDAVQSDPDDAVSYGQADGVPGWLTRAVTQADAVAMVGIAELHQYAGVSGGYKAAVVGCGGRATIAALHDRCRVMDPAVRLGEVQGNPFRGVIDALGRQLGRQLGPCLALNFVPSTGQWLAGPPAAVTRAAVDLLDPWLLVPRPYAGVVLRVPPVKASSLYQASRAATYLSQSPRPPLLPDATLVLDAACPEGLGSEAGFVAALSGCSPPWRALLDGPAPTGAGAQRAVMLALLATRYRLAVRNCVAPDALRAVGIDASGDPPPSGAGWLDVPRPFARVPQLRSEF